MTRCWTPAAPARPPTSPRSRWRCCPRSSGSTRDLTRLDPRSDGNFSFAGRNWLYNNVSLDGSYFNNPFGLDDPAPGGQTNAEPVPYDAVEQVQVSLAPFDVREGGFTGANINTVTKSGTNQLRGSLYTFGRNEALLGNTVRGYDVVADPDLSFIQSGFSLSGPLVRDKLFFFVNAELERTDDPGTNFVASTRDAGIRRVAGAGVGHGRHPPADDRRVRLRSRPVPGVHQRDQQQQGDRQARLEHQPRTTICRSGTTSWTPSATCRRTPSC